MTYNALARYGYGYLPPQLGDSEDYTTANVLAQYGRPKQGPIANALGIDPSLERDMILPMARPETVALPPTTPDQWKTASDVMDAIERSHGRRRSPSHWQFAVPQFAVDAINAADRVGTSPLTDRYARTDENRESMTDTAGAVVGPQIAAGFIRNALAKGGGSELGIFGGKLAKTADHNALARAESMDAQGLPREQIWKDTGWFKGVDGKWRFEIDDRGAAVTNWAWSGKDDLTKQLLDEQAANRGLGQNILAEDANASLLGDRLPSVVHHPVLYEAYPNIATGRGMVSEGPIGGMTDFRNISAQGPTINDAKSVALHELQHVVQESENWFPGHKGSGEIIGYDPVRRSAVAELNKSAPPDPRFAPWWRYMIPSSYERALETRMQWDKDVRTPRLNALDREAHHRGASEVEARAVQKRMDMTPEDRRARPPWLDYDVLEKDQVVKSSGNGQHTPWPLSSGRAYHNLPPGKSLTNALSDLGFGLVANGEYPAYSGLISRIKGEGLRSSRSYEASVPLSSIRPLQNPAELEAGRVTRYAENPPPRHVNVNEETGIELFRDGSQYYIGDGHHRFEAARRRGDVALDARVRDIFDPRVGQPPGRALTNALSEEVPHTVVSFDEKMNSILRKYGLLPPAVAGALAASNSDPAQARQ